MSVIISVNGNKSGEGFLISRLETKIFPVPLGLSTDDGSTINVNLQVAPGGAGIALDQTSLTVNSIEKVINMYATSPSTFRNDTVLEVRENNVLLSNFKLTVVTNPQIWFKGRFQARFATDGDYYNEKRGTDKGWNFALEGEPDFVPADSVPTDINKPVGREVLFNNPIVLRSHVSPIGVKVISIKGKVNNKIEEFFEGDPIIGQQVDLGPHTYLASNRGRNPPDPKPKEDYPAGAEPMALFEFNIANAFFGKSKDATDRPKSEKLDLLTAQEQTYYNVIVDQYPHFSKTFDENRKNVLLADYRNLTPEDRTGTIEGRNLATRIGHLGGEVNENISALNGTLPVGWAGKEEYLGLVNDAIQFFGLRSSILDYYRNFSLFYFFARMFNYHSDEQCGQVHGYLSTESIERSNIDEGIRELVIRPEIMIRGRKIELNDKLAKELELRRYVD